MPPLSRPFADALTDLRRGWLALRTRGPGQARFWLIALATGLVAGYAAVAFRLAISAIQTFLYGADDATLATTLASAPWYLVVAIPVLGGLAVGLLLQRFTADGKVHSVANVIEGAALRDGRVERRAGLASALASLITLSTGGSTGREGPVVHLGAVISSWVSDRIGADGLTARDLMGCAAAAAVAASFNAPIAGALFALEVVLRHFALHAIAPIMVAAVAGAVVSRLHIGNVPEFHLPVNQLEFYVELPAFMLLGLLSGLVAAILTRSVMLAEGVADTVTKALAIPRWVRPGVSGFLLGLLALGFPHIIGVGYETTSSALLGEFGFWTAVVLTATKVLAVALTFGGRMGGGIFSPSLMVGALTGLAFGHVATALMPGVSGTEALYALAGTGAVAAGVLGAPLSTTMIVFELTGDWQTGVAVMVSVSLASALASRLMTRSFFLTQLARQKKPVALGAQDYICSTLSLIPFTRPLTPEDAVRVEALVADGRTVEERETLDHALTLFHGGAVPVLAVLREGRPVALLHEADALRAFSAALVKAAREEHS
ncbi:chloride channel protein [Oceanicella sp. SM1341]|uniref:chloride channel protein n=1 Tax=Oceanicella sp. SM1341 TaxID=1548889 RepID=UPI000E5230B3|nr:chloride channel protein [Oceanicella sp. SM1341]